MSNRPANKAQEEKLQLAAKIAKSTNKVQHTYENIENSVLRVLRWFSGWIDRLLFNQKYSKLVAFVLAVLLYFMVNITDSSFSVVTQSGYVLENIPLTVSVDDSVYEVSGLPSTVTASIIGDVSDISMLKNSSSYKVVADLTGLGEGSHEVDLIATDFSSKLSVAVTPSKSIVTIRKKITRSFDLSYDFVNLNNLDGIYVLGTPSLSTTEVMVRASEETLNRIAFVKALIDVSNQTTSFSAEAPLAAYDSNGDKVDVSIIPSTITANVPITSPSKDVEVVVKTIGEVPNNKAINTISLDHASITIYAQSNVLQTINSISVDVDATQFTEDATYTAPIVAPSGVQEMSAKRVTMSVTLADKTSKEVEGVIINVINNVNGYRFNLVDSEEATTVVTCHGTQDNLDAITADDIVVNIDMAKVEVGIQDLQMSVSGSNPLVTYELNKPTITLEVIKG